MRYWIFEKTDSTKNRIIVKEINNNQLIVYSNYKGITNSSISSWREIDELKNNGQLEYIYSYQSLDQIPTENFFKLDREGR